MYDLRPCALRIHLHEQWGHVRYFLTACSKWLLPMGHTLRRSHVREVIVWTIYVLVPCFKTLSWNANYLGCVRSVVAFFKYRIYMASSLVLLKPQFSTIKTSDFSTLFYIFEPFICSITMDQICFVAESPAIPMQPSPLRAIFFTFYPGHIVS